MQKIDDLQYEFPEDFPPEARDLVSSLLREEPSERLGADDIELLKGHAFFSGMCPKQHATVRFDKTVLRQV